MRFWMFCNELGSFRTPGLYEEFKIKPDMLGLENFMHSYCDRVFEQETRPDPQQANIERGGSTVYGRNTFWVYPANDPWSLLGVTQA